MLTSRLSDIAPWKWCLSPRRVNSRRREFLCSFWFIVHSSQAILYIESALKPKFSWDSRWCKKLKWWIAYYTAVTLRVELVPQWKARRALAFCGKLIGIKSDRSMLTPLFMCNHVTLFKAFVEAIINSRCVKSISTFWYVNPSRSRDVESSVQ